MNIQDRSESKVVRASIIIAVAYVTKHFMGYELENTFLEAVVVILFAGWNVFAAWNDARRRDKF